MYNVRWTVYKYLSKASATALLPSFAGLRSLATHGRQSTPLCVRRWNRSLALDALKRARFVRDTVTKDKNGARQVGPTLAPLSGAFSGRRSCHVLPKTGGVRRPSIQGR